MFKLFTLVVGGGFGVSTIHVSVNIICIVFADVCSIQIALNDIPFCLCFNIKIYVLKIWLL